MCKKIIRSFILFYLLSSIWSIGIDAINIPESSRSLALLNSGSASSDDPQLNLTSLVKNDNSYVSFSSQNWLGEISGSQLLFVLPDNPLLISVRTLFLNDIEIRNEAPSTYPLGYTGARMVDCGIGYGYQNSLASMAVLVRVNYISLYTYRMYGATMDISMQRDLNNFSKVSFNVKNVGCQKFNELNGAIPTQIQLGSSFLLPFQIKLNFDAISTIYKNSDLVGSIEYNLRFIDLFFSASSGNLGSNYGLGFEFEFSNWRVSYGTMLHTLSYYSMPSFIDLSYSISR